MQIPNKQILKVYKEAYSQHMIVKVLRYITTCYLWGYEEE